jgi:phospholipase/lecithinase/hemolysin
MGLDMKLKLMRNCCLSVAFVALCSIASASAAAFSGLYVFGDSLSDVGNVSIATQGAEPVSPPYSDGRFSNGNLWVQDVAASLGLGPVTASLAGGNDFAVGGAETGETPANPYTSANPFQQASDLTAQLAAYNARGLTAQPNALYTLWIGSNDIDALFAALATVPLAEQSAFISEDFTAILGNISTVVSGLAADGMKTLLALNVPDLSKTPDSITAASGTANPTQTLDQIQAVSFTFDQALQSTLDGLSAAYGFKLNLVDTFSAIDSIVAQPNAFGLTDATQSCYTGGFTAADPGTVCADPNQYLFWDGLHPTAAGHQLVADAALTEVPEPGSVGLLGIAVVGLLWVKAGKGKGSFLQKRTKKLSFVG